MEEERAEKLRTLLDSGLHQLYGLWDEIGLDESTQRDRSQTVEDHFKSLLDRMIKEENGLKKRLVESLEHSIKQCVRLSKELGMKYDEPDSRLALIKLEHALRGEAKRLETVKEERMAEVLKLRKTDEELCQRLAVDPFYVSSTTVPTSHQMEGLKDHIRGLEEEKFTRLEQYVKLKETILSLYSELETEPATDFEREVACEDTDRFVLSTSNLTSVGGIVKKLEEEKTRNMRATMEAVEKLDSLYERLQLDMGEKYQFLSDNPGHGPSTITILHKEIERLEEIKKANIEKFVNTLRNELHKLWDDCFYSPEQRNRFSPLHSIDFTEELLEAHEAEAAKVKKYLHDNKELFNKVAQRQEVWNKFMELERRAKDPSRLLNARGKSLLVEEKERNKVNKALPRVEQELENLIADWERLHQTQFLVGGVCLKDFIETQKQEHVQQLEAEKHAREKQKKETLLQETRYGAKPSTPARLKGHNSTAKMTPARSQKLVPTPSSSRIVSRVASAVATMRSPRAGRVAKGTSPRIGGKPASKPDGTLRGKRRSSYGIKKDKKNKKMAAAQEQKMKKGILTEANYSLNGNDTIVRRGINDMSVASTVPDYGSFKQGNMLNSTEAGGLTPEVSTRPMPSYMTPTQTAQNRMFKTPTTPGSRSRSRLTPGSSTSKLSTLRSATKLPFLI